MESSHLDYVAQACMDLTEALASATNEADRDSLISNHIKKVWAVVPPVEDFKKSNFHSYVIFHCDPDLYIWSALPITCKP